MRIAKTWLWAAMFMAVVGGAALVVGLSHDRSATAQERIAGDHWAHHDGHWSFWHEGDRRWYYTDGLHWFYNDGRHWVLYPFDKLFGRKAFVRGEYKVPGEGAEVVVPRHAVRHPE